MPLVKSVVHDLRRRYLSPAQSVSYANTSPLLIVRGAGSSLFDERGTRFLDTRNNVAHVGHANARVAAAVSRQVRQLNTNTRYLHPNVCALARAVLGTLPPPLRDGGRVFFVNSGSEANDLALRIARAHYYEVEGGRRREGAVSEAGCVVLGGAYHGHTVGALALSPYKHDHHSFGGKGRPGWVEVAPAPDTYRGPFRGPDASLEYAAHLEKALDRLRRRGFGCAAFFVETGASVAGVAVPPPGYLRRCFDLVRGRGGLCVADEVQTGLGRVGPDAWYLFEAHGVVPDVVTLGKPMGNGMPLACVVASRAASEAFAKGPEYFNTFGGNPVCCAAGLAVLDVIADDDLRANAGRVGLELRRLLSALQARAPAPKRDKAGARVGIGDLRGSGLFLGIDLVRDASTREPATAEASLVCSRLLANHRIITSLDGPHDNVIVVKPPLCFSVADARRFVAALGAEIDHVNSLGDDVGRVERTPT